MALPQHRRWSKDGKTTKKSIANYNIFNDVNSSYRALLQKSNKDTLYLSRIKRMIAITYKIVHGIIVQEYMILSTC